MGGTDGKQKTEGNRVHEGQGEESRRLRTTAAQHPRPRFRRVQPNQDPNGNRRSGKFSNKYTQCHVVLKINHKKIILIFHRF